MKLATLLIPVFFLATAVEAVARYTFTTLASLKTEVENPVACPPQWLPVILAVNPPVPPTNGRRLQTTVFMGADKRGTYTSKVLLAVNTPVPPTNGRRLQTTVFATKSELKTAAQEYNADPASAEGTYGPIDTWEVSSITDMSGLFSGSEDFNADISSWSTSGVTSMEEMFEVSSSLALRLQFPVGPSSLHAACAATAPLPPICRPASRALFLMTPLRLGTGRGGIQPAAESRHVQRHSHEGHVSCAFHACPTASPSFSAYTCRPLSHDSPSTRHRARRHSTSH